MATSRGRRITVVNPWIPGGEGQFRDLFPLPPVVFLFFRLITKAFKHYLITLTIITALWLLIAKDWAWWQAFILFPLALIFLRGTIITFWLWYRNPNVPLFARRQ